MKTTQIKKTNWVIIKKFKYQLICILAFSLPLNLLKGNCECSSCPFHINHVGQSSSTLTVSGATNNVLGQNGQRLRGVRINFWHDAIRECHLTLRAPDGSEVKLFNQPPLIQWWRNNIFEICFVDCQEDADPDPGFSANFDPDEFFANENYYGVYYPFDPNECLSNLTGSVNGTWTLIWEDFVGGMDGNLFSWSLEFADNSGTNCSDACALSDCHANGGEIDGAEGLYCTGSPDLFFIMNVNHQGNDPDPALYGYTYVIADENGLIIEYTEFPDLSNFPTGNYQICGLSYKLEDFPLIPQPNGSYTVDDLSADIGLSLFCARLSIDCEWVTIIDPVEEPELSGPEFVCNGEEVTYILSPDFDFDEIDQLEIQGNVINQDINLPLINVSWGYGQNNRICVSVSNDCSGPIEDCIDVEVYEPPVVSIIGGALVCEGEVYNYTIDPPTKPGESWFIEITGGELVSQDQDEFQVIWYPHNGNNFVQVTLLNAPCPEPIQGFLQIELFDIHFPDDYNLPHSVCEGEIVEAFVPIDPLFYSYYWTAYGVEVVSGENSNGPVQFYAESSGTADICLEVETVCGYLGPECKTIEITSPPGISDLEVECVGTDYILTITISGGSAPYLINGNTIQGNQFTLDPIAGGDPYSLLIQDANFCENEFTGVIECDCIADAGSMTSDTLDLCASEGSIVWASHMGGDTMDINDAGIFVLHTLSGNNLGTIIATSETGMFSWQDDLQTGSIYYISYVVGEADGELINWSDPCLSVSRGQPIRINSIPDFEIPGFTAQCWSDVSIPINSGNQGELALLSSGDANVVDFEIQDDQIFIRSDAPAELVFEYSEYNISCFRADTFTVMLWELPEVNSIVTHCIGETFTGSFQIQGGSSPWVINGLETDDPTIQIDTFDSGTLLEFVIADANGCEAQLLEFTADCDCLASAGSFGISEIELCEGESIDIINLPHDGIVEEDDFLVFYILHNGSSNQIGDLLSISTGDPILWEATFSIDFTYYLTAVITTTINGEIDFNDPCLHMSQGIPVIWSTGPTVSISGEELACIGEEIVLTISSEGPLPFDLTLLSSDGELLNLNVSEQDQTMEVPQIPGITNWEIISVESECPAEFSGSFTAQFQQPLEIELFEPPVLCNNQLFGSALDLNLLLVEETEGQWYVGQELIEDGLIDFDGLDAGLYEVHFTTEGFENPCPGNQWDIEIVVEDCKCPAISLPDSILVCSDITSVILPEGNWSQFSGNWNIENPNNYTFVPETDQETILVPTDSEGVFELFFTLTDSFPPECQTNWLITLEIEKELYSGHQIDFPEFCNNTPGALNLNELLESQSDNGQWVLDGNSLEDGLLSTRDFDPGTHIFTYRVGPGRVCPADESQVMFNIFPEPEFIVLSENPSCFGSSDGSIKVVSENEENSIDRLILDNQEFNENEIVGLNAGVYDFIVINEFECKSNPEFITLLEPDELFVYIAENIEVIPGDIYQINAEVNFDETEIQTIVWTDNKDTLGVGSLWLSISFSEALKLRIDITTIDSCIVSGIVEVLLKNLDIYLPNVFRPGSGISNNAVFGPLGKDLSEVYEFSIFNRWGGLVHQVRNIPPDAVELFWDGNIRTESAAEGVYIYHLIYQNLRGETITLKGDVLLIR
ncbi:MAG: hypothetical protein EA362_04710 [Saprospirales bacterium]|nr:MAG: hypothetical protein EA362_04710 [Saprospirales bacterium]